MQTPPNILELSGYSVAFGDKVVLADIDLTIEDRTVSLLLGPSGSGKSTLLRTVAGLNDAHPALTTWGEARFQGKPLRESPPPTAGTIRPGIAYVRQHAQFFLSTIRENLVTELPNRSQLDYAAQTEVISELLCAHGLERLVPQLNAAVADLPKPTQRKLALLRTVLSNPALLLADEITTGLDDAAAVEVLLLLQEQARHRAVVVILHNQRLARLIGDTVILLSGGRIREIASCDAFYTNPKSESAQSFITTGSCSDPSPSARPEDIDPERVAVPAYIEPPTRHALANAPRGFYWLLPGQLGGVPRPGIGQRTTEEDLDGLAALQLTTLVTLEEEPVVKCEALAQRGISSVHFPIDDMRAPTCEAAQELCASIEERLAQGEVIAVHCRGGLGRTGTVLAAQLIFRGSRAFEAIERVRSINARWIQSDAQFAFLSLFDVYVRSRKGESLS